MFQGNDEFIWKNNMKLINSNKFSPYLVFIFGKIHKTQGKIKLIQSPGCRLRPKSQS